MVDASHDVVILGGGLAGLTLAMQLRGECPELDIVVIERRSHPLPRAAHKVGESLVEIGAHYLADTLGLREHLESAHVHKFGFRFFFSDGCDDLGKVTELGVSKVLPTPTYQVDRGILENFLYEEALRRGIDVRDGSRVVSFELGHGGARHQTACVDDAGERSCLASRWLFDASGRAGLIRRRLELTRDNGHHANAVWFRVDDRIEIDDWCNEPHWQSRCEPAERWRSTNHLCGPGYWSWLIPLGSGAHSVGIVADAAMHPIASMNSYERACDWLAVHQPALARRLQGGEDKLLDFAWLRDYSYASARVFSADRWALTGEAGPFLDPFYSPGTDFIAIANTYICALVKHDLAGRQLAPYARLFERLFLSFYDTTLSLFRHQYPLMGNAQVLPIKVIWDYAYYWGVLCQLVFQHRLDDASLYSDMARELEAGRTLNERMQGFFRRWHAHSARRNHPVMLDQQELPWFAGMNATLHEPLDDASLRARLRHNLALLEGLAATIVERASADGGGSLHDDMADLGRTRVRPSLFAA